MSQLNYKIIMIFIYYQTYFNIDFIHISENKYKIYKLAK